MFDIGFSELLIFGAIALIVLGPEKLPQAARTAGQWYAKFRRTVSTLQSEIEAELDLAETRKKMQEELAKIRQAEADMKREMDALKGSIKQFQQSQDDSLKSPAKKQPALSSEHAEAPQVTAPQNQKSTDSDSLENPDSIDSDTHQQTPELTRPWENMWFRLGEYDKARRLPAAPWLPNYEAAALLHAPLDSTSLDSSALNQNAHGADKKVVS